jgi:diadenosine tetraphosphate (Ap4A) HIT family hydrolase
MEGDEYLKALEKFSVDENHLAESEYWLVTLRPKQIALGALMLLPRQPIDDFDALRAPEAADLFHVVARCQVVLRRTFAADKFNLIAAMMKDNFVHFHLVPRYSERRELAGTAWIDSDWPGLIDFGRDVPPPEARMVVLQNLQGEFSKGLR